MIGIMTYISEQNETTIVHEGETLNKDEAIDYIYNMNKSNQIKK